MSIVRIEDPKTFIGLSVEEARRQIIDHGYDTRVVQTRLVYKPNDYDPLRVVLVVKDDRVAEAFIG